MGKMLRRVVESGAPKLRGVPELLAQVEMLAATSDQAFILQSTVSDDLLQRIADSRLAVQGAREDIAHLRGAVDESRRELREDIAHLRGAVDELRRVADSTQGELKLLAQDAYDNRLGVLRGLLTRVEHYQPIYGLAGLVGTPQRDSVDRARLIATALGGGEGRRVLDLGSSLGYFSFYLADRGAFVTGWDFKADNVAICRLVSDITGVRADFLERTIDLETVSCVPRDEYDVVLALSVFHHVVASEGLEAAREIVRRLFTCAPTMIVELAAKGEDSSLYWDASQPDDPLDLFAAVRDEVEIVHLGTHGTHLSTSDRSLYLVRRRNLIEVGSRSFAFDHERYEPYPDAPIGDARGDRRYYFSDDFVVKQYRFDEASPENWRQIMSELNFFTAVLPLGKVFRAPELVAYEIDRSMARLAFTRTPGNLMCERGVMETAEVEVIVLDVLRSLAELHDLGLYHNDVRSWNIVTNDTGGWLIDYGLCGPVSYDDDAVSLVWAAAAVLTGSREPYGVNKPDLPDAAMFRSPAMMGLYAAVAAGERSPRRLLDVLGFREQS